MLLWSTKALELYKANVISWQILNTDSKGLLSFFKTKQKQSNRQIKEMT